MRILKYLFAIAAFSFAVTSCEVVGENIFPTTPVAPELEAHADIIMTSNTMTENVNFSWSKARFMGESVSYELCAYNGADSIILAPSSTETYYESSKTDFKTKIYEGLPTLPINDTFSLTFKVNATSDVGKFFSTAISVDIYAFGTSVSAVVKAASEGIVLDMTKPMDEVKLITWTPARLEYEEAVEYSVYLRYEKGQEYEYAKEITGLAFNTTVDKLNEGVIAAGAPEGKKSKIQVIVKAFSETMIEGLPSVADTIEITTYIATFPDFMYVPGDFPDPNNWSPADAAKMPHSTVTKGLYEGVVDLQSKSGAAEVAFKFSPNPEWKDDFSIGNVVITKFAETYSAVTGSGLGPDNITVPVGLYNIVLNKKLNTLKMFQIETLGIIGDAVGGWKDDHDMEYDAVAQTFTVTVDLEKGKGFKFRPNDNFDYSLGGSQNNVSATEGGNIAYEGEDGNYKVVLNVATNPYTIKYINTSFPDNLYVPGDHQGYSPATASMLVGNGAGQYEGFSNLKSQFKFTPTRAADWAGAFGGTLDNLLTAPGTGNIPMTEEGLYYLRVDLTTLKVTTAYKVTRVGIIGEFNGWGTPDTEMTYDAASKKWVATGLNIAEGTDYKFRLNDKWDHDFGGAINNLVYKEPNMKAPAGGITKITLSLEAPPYSATLN